MSDLSEKTYLAELIRDFRTGKSIDIDAAWKGIQVKYRVLDVNKENFVETVLSENRTFGKVFFLLAKSIHGFMFDDVLSNAGEFRRAADPNHGFVAFGGDVQRNPWGSKFMGSPPERIEIELRSAFDLLSKDDPDPVRTSIIFYQKFVHIHPFYDANGRVARFLLTLYLLFHGYYVLWKQLEEGKKNEFLKKLNACHLRQSSASYNEYLQHLHRFWKQFVVSKATFTTQG